MDFLFGYCGNLIGLVGILSVSFLVGEFALLVQNSGWGFVCSNIVLFPVLGGSWGEIWEGDFVSYYSIVCVCVFCLSIWGFSPSFPIQKGFWLFRGFVCFLFWKMFWKASQTWLYILLSLNLLCWLLCLSLFGFCQKISFCSSVCHNDLVGKCSDSVPLLWDCKGKKFCFICGFYVCNCFTFNGDFTGRYFVC